jgi:SAM-dependent methyltransferase
VDRCPVCASDTLLPLFQAEQVPVFCNVQWSDREQARRAPQATLEIVACTACGHAFNAAFDPGRVPYSPAYDNSQHFSATFREYATRLADRLIDTYGIRQKSVVDIGCGRGDLLMLMAQRGRNRGFGFDPSVDPATTEALKADVTLSREYFAREHATDLAPALVCCRHVLEHVFDPLQFLVSLRYSLAGAGAPLLYLEVPSGEHLLRSAGLWDYIYEHYSYFSRNSLEIVLRAAGFEALRIDEDFGGQFLCAEARPMAGSREAPTVRGPVIDSVDITVAAKRMRAKISGWREWAESLSASGRTATIWGAGSKGVMFLNLLGLSAPDPVDFAIDQNPNKSNRYIAVSGQVILAPEALARRDVDEVVVMNPIYRDEILTRLGTVGSRAAITTV